MGFLTSEKAPYLVALLVSLLGWHLAQLTDDIRSTRSVTYTVNVDETSGRIIALVHNVSKNHSLTKARFSLACLPGQACLATGTPHVKAYPPNGAAVGIVSEPSAVTLTATLPPGGKIEFGGKLSGSGGRPQFLFVPDTGNVLDIYVFDGSSVRGVLVRHYFTLIFLSFAVLSLLLLGLLIRLVFSRPALPPSEKGSSG